MKFKIGDRVRVVERDLFGGCEGYICEIPGEDGWAGSYLVDLYKGNDRITQEECDMYLVYFNDDNLELI